MRISNILAATFLLNVLAGIAQRAASEVNSSAIQVIQDYARATQDGDTKATLSFWHPEVIASVGGRARAREILIEIYHNPAAANLSDRIELGSSIILHDEADADTVLALVPSVQATKGFPADIGLPKVYALHSTDGGAHWQVIDRH